jgi:hypothetical protein
MLACAPVKSPVSKRARINRLLSVVYLPLFVWSLIGAGWTTAHHRFTLSYWLAYLILVAISLAFKRRVGLVVVMIGVAWCHALGAFALLAWLRLRSWTGLVFFVLSFALLIVHGARAASMRFRSTRPKTAGQ